MYSPAAERLLMQAGVQVGEPVIIERGGQSFEGLLMPRPDIGDEGCLVLKLKSGYNIGVSIEGAKISKAAGKAEDFLSAVPIGAKVYPSSKSAPASDKTRPPIYLLSTGGTIASKVDYATGAVSPQLDANELLASIPALSSLAPLKTRSVLSLLSEDLLPSHWALFAQGVADAFKDGAGGIVIAHGTDTMGYTAAALAYSLQDLPGPVVLTGAQRSPDRGSSDAADNLFASCLAARAPWAGVAICMHAGADDSISHLHWGTRVRKYHSSARGAFRSIGLPPIGRADVRSGQVAITDSDVPKADSARHLILKNKFSENAHMAWIYPGLTPKTVEKWADYDGVLLAGTGLGHAPVWSSEPSSKHSILPALRQLHSSGVLLAMASQTFGGRVNMDVYSPGRLLQEAGVIGQECDWLAETAYVKMCWALGQEKDVKKAAKLMLAPRARDLLPRSPIEDALPSMQDRLE
ncbi:MAG: Glu-tRNA(Gln) amidotransferase subunit GatD [Candidatus Marsarchaeota archaeon]|nr:Glu-tRNA(Gln) amidotransferase subunit GatD [Candidatus Marsarchaeota archaeon]